jgi:hypothetical protein
MRAAVAVLGIVLGCNGGDPRQHELANQEAQRAAQASRDAQERLMKVSKDLEAQHQLAKLSKDLDDLNAKVASAVDAVVAAPSDADRAFVKARLIQLQQEEADLRARIAAAKAAADLAKPTDGVMGDYPSCTWNRLVDCVP